MKKEVLFIILIYIFSGCANNDNAWFFVNKLDENTYIISEPESSQGNSCFLILGDNEAILFDSGSGEQKGESITRITDSLTNLPVTLVLSHFHFDHIGNIFEFERLAMPEIEEIISGIDSDGLLLLNRNDVLSDDTVSVKVSGILPLDREIDLGNRKIQILHTPGHSDESITIVDHQNKFIFTGDLIYNGLLLINDCNEYTNSINRILENSGPEYRVFGSHGLPEVSYERLPETVNAVESYLGNEIPFESVRNINLNGTGKKVYRKENISFIVGYQDAF